MAGLTADLPLNSAAELALIGLIYSSVFSVHTRFSALQYNKIFKKTSSMPLVLHIASGIWEILFYHIRALAGPVRPTRYDVFLCLIQSSTTLILVKPLRRGHPRMTRPCYQAGAILRPIITGIAFVEGSSVLHQSSIKVLNGFIYTRVMIWLLRRLNLVPSYQDMYNIGVFGAALLAVSESSIRYGPHIYVCTVMLVALLNEQVSVRLVACIHGRQPLVLLAFVTLGFSELQTVRNVGNIEALMEIPTDEYEEGFTEKHGPNIVEDGAARSRAYSNHLALFRGSLINQPYCLWYVAHFRALFSAINVSGGCKSGDEMPTLSTRQMMKQIVNKESVKAVSGN